MQTFAASYSDYFFFLLMASSYTKYFVVKLRYISPASIDLSDLCYSIAKFAKDENKNQVL